MSWGNVGPFLEFFDHLLKVIIMMKAYVVPPWVGVSDKWPKFKYQIFKSTKWFSYKIWIKNSWEPIVYLHNWPLPEKPHFLKILWEIHFFTFLNTDQNAKKYEIEIWTFSFQICFRNQFSTWSNWKYAITLIDLGKP